MAYVLAAEAPPHLLRLDEVLAASLGPDRETWGTEPQAQRAAAAMEALVGGPAPPKR